MNMQDKISGCAQAAQEYAARGWHVFPVPVGKKESHKSAKFSNGRKWGATTDLQEIAQDWRQWPEANIGIVTGPKSGLLVIEADTEAGHSVDGIGNLAALIEQNGPLPDTIEALSPSGSWHLFFKWPEGWDIRNSAGQVAPGVDVRGDGGMVVAVPSVKPRHDKPYRWKNPPGLFDLGDCPDWLLRLCLKPEPKLLERAMPMRSTGNAWAETALRGEIAELLAAPEGKRNAALNKAAFSLGQIMAGGSLSEGLVVERLTVTAQGIGLEPVEIEATIQSGMQAGAKEPRTPKSDLPAHTSDGEPRPNQRDDALDLSHDALANEMGRRGFSRNARYVSTWGKWLFWDRTRWTVDERMEHMTRTREFLRTRAAEMLAWAERKAATLEAEKADKLMKWAEQEARTLRNKNTVAAIESLARSNSDSVASPDLFDADRLLLGTPGGTVDLRTGKMRLARREDYITKLTSVTPQSGTPRLWLQFLNEIFDGDADLIAFMQRAAGYALTGETREHKLLFLYGTGRNGKSVFLNMLFDIWGDYAKRAAAQTFLNTNGDKHPTDVAGLQGARLVAGSELPKGKTWDESVIKDLTGGDKMTARYMRQDFFDFDPQLTLMIAGNNQPSFRGVDEAIRARVVLVPFTVTIPPERRDKHLPDKLKAEAGQILAWAIEGALQWQEKGLDVPAKVAAASSEYFDDEDTLGQFLTDETERGDAMAFVTTSALHQRFTQWCDQQGLNSWTLRTLQKEVRSRGYDVKRRNIGAGFLGLKLK
ncbi:P4 family phage/plasmid primase-like protein [Roseinatronobacter thiooxidans]|uniref:P4 family phage/plasmid primase-like protein n=1 Tax=Roseinatronobacter thiooxidans TaxID=121821 RepID=A0A2W7R1R7_9RHOB|nr:phage/plasmid primase, P4 family [Roseinatronobacter thiooxidans]PZX44575.1 P4 family phage/plasmid primase-like protein [Roseinatronobacter thiooxidans]